MEQSARKKKLGGYPAVGVVVSTTLALFVIGLFGLLLIYSQQMERLVRENVRMQVYLKSNVTETQRLQVENKLLSMDFVNPDVGRGVTFVSKDEAAEKMIKDTGEDFKEFLGENPLKDAFMVSIDPAYHSKEQMEKIKKEIQGMTGVFEVAYIEGLIESINKNVTNIGLVLIGLVCLLLLTVVLLINNTLRLALFSQRFLIRSMQLVGAKSGFIQRPFLVRSIGYGVLSGVLASAALFTATHYAGRAIADLSELYDQNKMMMLTGTLLLLGAFVALVSTFFSIRRYLRMSLDELY